MKTIKQFKNNILSFLALFSAAGCSTTYQKEGFFTNGYSDSRLGEDRFTIAFSANEQTDPETVRIYAIQRAADLTLKRGYRYFAVIEQVDNVPHYPSVKLTIQCFHEKPVGIEVMDARQNNVR